MFMYLRHQFLLAMGFLKNFFFRKIESDLDHRSQYTCMTIINNAGHIDLSISAKTMGKDEMIRHYAIEIGGGVGFFNIVNSD